MEKLKSTYRFPTFPQPRRRRVYVYKELRDTDSEGKVTLLRPRLNAIVRWEAMGTDERGILQSFLRNNTSRPEGLYGPLLVRLLAAFERYTRALVVWTVEQRNSSAKRYEDLSINIANRNRTLTGRVLASAELPEYLVFDVPALIENLATCKQGPTFRLNPMVFSFGIKGCSPKHLDAALEHVEIDNYWDTVGNDSDLINILGTKGARATGICAKDKLKELTRQRNHLAHGGDGAPVISETDLRDAIRFIDALAKALEDVVVADLDRR